MSIFMQPSGYTGSAPYGGVEPPYGLPTQSDSDPQKELPFNGLYRISGALDHKPDAPPARENLQLLIKDLSHPNGIAFSPDGKYLYVDNSEPQKFWIRYEVRADGSLEAGTMFFDAGSNRGYGGPDGMKVDQRRNVFSAGQGGVWIFSPEGKHLGTLHVPEKAVGNVAWGDEDSKGLYITASASVYRIRVKVPGVRP